jgi:tetratricopeptide (TPR) repeat protein
MSKNCLNEETLTSYLDDSLQVVARAAAEEHLVSCDACRSRLVYYMRILDDDVREEEEPVVAAAMEAWDPARIPVPARGWLAATRSRLMTLALVASVLTAIALGAIFGLYNPRPIGTAERLEAQLRRERPFEARTSLQETARDWVEFRNTRDAVRAAADNTGEDDIALSEAEGANPSNHLLGLQYLTAGSWDPAVDRLIEAFMEAPSDPAVQNDLGVVYLERPKEDARSQQNDYELAEGYFDNAMSIDANYLPAQFNLALLYERKGSRPELEDAVRDYLAMDPDSGWARDLQDLSDDL